MKNKLIIVSLALLSVISCKKKEEKNMSVKEEVIDIGNDYVMDDFVMELLF